jgi:hypothetical protein
VGKVGTAQHRPEGYRIPTLLQVFELAQTNQFMKVLNISLIFQSLP